MKTIEQYVLLFFIYSFLGWTLEVFRIYVGQKKLVNRGFLIGPICPIYGYGALLMTIMPEELTPYPIALFFSCLIVCSVLEYLTSYFMEKIFHARWWDYSNVKFNINGRICLRNMIYFGILGCIVIYISNPFIIKYLNMMPDIAGHITCGVILLIYLIDNIVSFNIIQNIKLASTNIKDNTEEISKKVKRVLLDKSALTRRVFDAFPALQDIRKKIKDQAETFANNMKEKRETFANNVKKTTKIIRKDKESENIAEKNNSNENEVKS